jgi:hypothetical protein
MDVMPVKGMKRSERDPEELERLIRKIQDACDKEGALSRYD